MITSDVSTSEPTRSLLKRATNTSAQSVVAQEQVTTVGFTVKGCLPLIDAALANPVLLGWYFHFPPSNTGGKVKDITISTLEAHSIGGRKVLRRIPLVTPPGEERILPKLHTQHYRPDFSSVDVVPDSVSEYQNFPAEQLAFFVGSSYASADPAIDELSHYTEWAEAAFFRRTDLEFLRMALDSQVGTYNDVFFSGSAVDYSTMNNPRFRVSQFTLNNGSVEDSSKAFTLKAEPINNTLDNVDMATPTMFGNARSASTMAGPVTDQDASLMIPAVFQATPCPDYWSRVDMDQV